MHTYYDSEKKKRGRKPKSYHIQKMLDVARQKEQIQIENEINRGDEVSIDSENMSARAHEYRMHPLYGKL